jgi:hypothetical protein
MTIVDTVTPVPPVTVFKMVNGLAELLNEGSAGAAAYRRRDTSPA